MLRRTSWHCLLRIFKCILSVCILDRANLLVCMSCLNVKPYSLPNPNPTGAVDNAQTLACIPVLRGRKLVSLKIHGSAAGDESMKKLFMESLQELP